MSEQFLLSLWRVYRYAFMSVLCSAHKKSVVYALPIPIPQGTFEKWNDKNDIGDSTDPDFIPVDTTHI